MSFFQSISSMMLFSFLSSWSLSADSRTLTFERDIHLVSRSPYTVLKVLQGDGANWKDIRAFKETEIVFNYLSKGEITVQADANSSPRQYTFYRFKVLAFETEMQFPSIEPLKPGQKMRIGLAHQWKIKDATESGEDIGNMRYSHGEQRWGVIDPLNRGYQTYQGNEVITTDVSYNYPNHREGSLVAGLTQGGLRDASAFGFFDEIKIIELQGAGRIFFHVNDKFPTVGSSMGLGTKHFRDNEGSLEVIIVVINAENQK